MGREEGGGTGMKKNKLKILNIILLQIIKIRIQIVTFVWYVHTFFL